MGCVDKCGPSVLRSSSFGRKRVTLLSGDMEFGNDGGCASASTRKKCVLDAASSCSGQSALENLPQEILIRIVCGVEHDDLKTLFSVSKSIRETTLIAKQMHFAYKTPRKSVGLKKMESISDLEEIKAPNAPKQTRVWQSRLSGKKLADISVALFRDLVLEVETRN